MDESDTEELNNEFIANWSEYLISAFVGIPNTDITHILFDSEPFHSEPLFEPHEPYPLTGQVHYIEHTEEQGPSKRPHIEQKEENEKEQKEKEQDLVRRQIPRYRYLKLLSGATFHFSDEKGILTTALQEPNLYLRKLLSRIPKSIRGRLEFLALFEDESQNQVIEADLEETDEWIVPTPADLEPISHLFTNLREQLYMAYIREMRMRRAFRTLLQRWRIRRIDQKEHSTTDPITLTEPVHPVIVYDITCKARYVFDASSLATWIESNLMYHEGGFAIPMSPRNPWTNSDFTYLQLVSIYEQLKACGELRWGLTTLRTYQFNKSRWQLFHDSTLTLSAIRTSLTLLDSDDARELLEDFIYSKMEDLHIYVTPTIRTVYHKAIFHVPRHWYLEEFKAVAYLHYEAEHFHEDRRRLIHNRCDHIFRKQNQFIGEIQRLLVP